MSTLPAPPRASNSPDPQQWQAVLRYQREQIDRQWQHAIEAFAKRLQSEWERFSRIVDAIREDELPAEEISPVFAAFDELRQLGVRFDPTFILRMNSLRRQVALQDVDGLDDMHDEYLGDDGSGYRASFADAKQWISNFEHI